MRGSTRSGCHTTCFCGPRPVLLAAAAIATRRVMLGVGVLNPYSAHPVELAMHATTLQELSGGRAILGIAAGAAGFLELAGISQDEPLHAYPPNPAGLPGAPGRRHPGGDRGHRGMGAGPLACFAPAQRSAHLPGAMSPKMLMLGGELADGVLALLFPPEHYPVARGHITRGARPGPSSSPVRGYPGLRVGFGRRRPGSGRVSAGTEAGVLRPRVRTLLIEPGRAGSGRLRPGRGGAAKRRHR